MNVKYIFSSLVFSVFMLASNGQNQLGIFIGTGNLYILNDNSSRDQAYYSSPHAYSNISIEDRHSISKRFTLAIALEYQNQSFNVQSSWGGAGASNTASLSFHYGKMNLQLMPQIVFGRKLKFYMYPGFYFGKLIHSRCSGNITIVELGNPNPKVEYVNGSGHSYFHSIDIGVLAGVGCVISITKKISLHVENRNSYCWNGMNWGANKANIFTFNLKAGFFYKL